MALNKGMLTVQPHALYCVAANRQSRKCLQIGNGRSASPAPGAIAFAADFIGAFDCGNNRHLQKFHTGETSRR
jgi:hypothetical protein